MCSLHQKYRREGKDSPQDIFIVCRGEAILLSICLDFFQDILWKDVLWIGHADMHKANHEEENHTSHSAGGCRQDQPEAGGEQGVNRKGLCDFSSVLLLGDEESSR